MNLELSPIDKLFIGPHGYPIEMSFYFSSRLDPLFLQAALDRLAEKWPWLRAQLKMDSQTAWLESAAHPLSIRVQEVDFIAAPDDVTKFASLRTDIQTTTGRPLIEVHLTLGENSSWLTVGMAHFFGDGYSYFLFLKNLSLVAMKQEPMAIQWDRSSIKQTASNTTSSTAISEGEAPNRPYVFGGSRSRFLELPDSWKLEAFEKSDLEAALTEAQKFSTRRLFPHDWLCAHQWRNALASPLASPSPVVQLNTPVDFRRFRKDTLGSLFFGNAIYLATVRASTADIISAPVGNTAGSVREAIRGTLEERIQAQIDLFAQDQKEKGLNSVPTWNLFQPGSPTLVTNLSALPLNEIRLGAEAEAPLCVRYTGAFPGLAVVLPDIDGKVRIQSFGS